MRGGALDQIHDILNEGLTPILRVAFEDAWGKNWIDVLNSTVQRPPEQNSKKDEREDYRIIKRGDSGLAVWDDNQICHTIKRNIWKRRIDKQEKEALRGYYDGKAERLAELCQKIVDSRNLKGHRNVETAKKALSSRNVIRCGEAAVELLLAFRCRSQADEISQLLDGHDDLAARSYQSGAVAAGTQAAVTEGDDTPAVAQPLNVGQESLDPRDFGGGRYTSSRRRSLPPPGAGVAVFPTVGEGAQGDTEQNSLASIKAIRAPSDATRGRSSSPDVDERPEYLQAINDIRYDEANPAKANEKTHIKFDPTDFMGTSFGLACAIADRTIRYGISEKYADRRIVATGEVASRQYGKVSAINGLNEKIDIVSRYMPAGTLFVFPNENLARADQSTRDALDQLRAKGIEWRTVSHVDDLNDLLLPAEEESQPEAASKKQPPEAIAIEVLPEAPQRAAPLPQLSIAPAVRKSSLRRYGMAGAATGLVILLAVAAIANWFEAGRLDPAVIQASDERLNALAQTASGLAAGKMEPQACLKLVQAAKAITDFDRSRFDKDNQAGFDRAQGCRAALAESDNRIRALVASASAEDAETPNGTARLVKASASLTDFDKDRDLTEEARKAIAAASAGSASFEASDKRIDAFSAAFAAWQQRQDDGKAAELALAAVGALRPLDTQRAPADVQSKIKQSSLLQGLIDQSDARISKAVLAVSALQSKDTPDNRTAAQDAVFAVTNFDSSRATASQQKILDDGRKLPSQLRWQDFAATVADFRKGPDAAATLKLAEAFRALTASDRIAFNDQLRTARPDAEKALQTVADSDLRLSALASAFSAVQIAEKKKKQLLNPYLSLISAADALGPFDNGRLSDVLAAALKKSGLIKKALAESDNRISAAIEWAETASKLKDRAVPRKIMKNVQITRNALTDLDKERLSSAQKAILDDVCGVPVEPEPGMLPAIDGYDCYQPGDFAPKPLPAIAQ